MKKILFILSIFLITGCANSPSSKLDVQDTKIIYDAIPEHLLKPCESKKPISKEEYLLLKRDLGERETYLTNYSIDLLGIIKDCNKQIDEIRKLNDSKSRNKTGPKWSS